jgi:hypothetical protein
MSRSQATLAKAKLADKAALHMSFREASRDVIPTALRPRVGHGTTATTVSQWVDPTALQTAATIITKYAYHLLGAPAETQDYNDYYCAVYNILVAASRSEIVPVTAVPHFVALVIALINGTHASYGNANLNAIFMKTNVASLAPLVSFAGPNVQPAANGYCVIDPYQPSVDPIPAFNKINNALVTGNRLKMVPPYYFTMFKKGLEQHAIPVAAACLDAEPDPNPLLQGKIYLGIDHITRSLIACFGIASAPSPQLCVPVLTSETELLKTPRACAMAHCLNFPEDANKGLNQPVIPVPIMVESFVARFFGYMSSILGKFELFTAPSWLCGGCSGDVGHWFLAWILNPVTYCAQNNLLYADQSDVTIFGGASRVANGSQNPPIGVAQESSMRYPKTLLDGILASLSMYQGMVGGIDGKPVMRTLIPIPYGDWNQIKPTLLFYLNEVLGNNFTDSYPTLNPITMYDSTNNLRYSNMIPSSNSEYTRAVSLKETEMSLFTQIGESPALVKPLLEARPKDCAAQLAVVLSGGASRAELAKTPSGKECYPAHEQIAAREAHQKNLKDPEMVKKVEIKTPKGKKMINFPVTYYQYIPAVGLVSAVSPDAQGVAGFNQETVNHLLQYVNPVLLVRPMHPQPSVTLVIAAGYYYAGAATPGPTRNLLQKDFLGGQYAATGMFKDGSVSTLTQYEREKEMMGVGGGNQLALAGEFASLALQLGAMYGPPAVKLASALAPAAKYAAKEAKAAIAARKKPQATQKAPPQKAQKKKK